MNNNITNSSTTLLPCPFCGSKSVSYIYDLNLKNYRGRHPIKVTCNVCCATTGLFNDKEMARNTWNRRTTIHE